MAYITSDGTSLYVDTAGQGTPVLLLHGFSLDHRQWDPQWPMLADAYAANRLDMRAHGRSATSATGYSHAAMLGDVQRVMAQIGMDRLHPGFVVGHSMAADTALQVALAEPRAVRGVIAVTPAVWGHRWSDEWLAMWREMRTLARAGDVPAALARFRSDALFDGLRVQPEWGARLGEMHAGCTGAHLRSDERDSGPSTLERLATCNVPILVLAAAGDREDFRTAAREIAAAAPHAELHEFPAAGHFPNLECPAAFNLRLLEFLSRHS